jgi:hypothetical protein
MSLPRKASSARRSKRLAVTMPRRPIPTPRLPSTTSSRAPISSCPWSSKATPRVSNGQIAQRVHIVDANGEAWEALYTLEQQPDGSLKITGCSLLKAGQAV